MEMAMEMENGMERWQMIMEHNKFQRWLSEMRAAPAVENKRRKNLCNNMHNAQRNGKYDGKMEDFA